MRTTRECGTEDILEYIIIWHFISSSGSGKKLQVKEESKISIKPRALKSVLSNKTGITLSASLGMCGKGAHGELLITTIIYQIKACFERSDGMYIL